MARTRNTTTTPTPAPLSPQPAAAAPGQLVSLAPGELAQMLSQALADTLTALLPQLLQGQVQGSQAPRTFLKAAGFVQITGITPARGLGTIPPGSQVALVQCEAVAVRWRDDGTAPTATVGNLLNPGDTMSFDQRLDKIMVIQTAAGSILNVSFYASP